MRTAAILLRERWIFLLVTATVAFFFVLVSFVRPTTWTTSTTFIPQETMDGTQQRLSMLADQFGIGMGGGQAGHSPQFYASLVQSQKILARIASDTFEVAASGDGRGSGTAKGTVADLLQVDEESSELRTSIAMDWLGEEALDARANLETGIVRLSVTTPWPHLSAEIASRILELVNEFNLSARQSRAAAERQFVQARMTAVEGELRAAESALKEFLQSNRAFANSPELAFEHDRLQRKLATIQQVYASLADSYEQARIAEVRNTPVITVVDPPRVPVLPDSRRLSLFLALGLILGAAAGAMAAILRDYDKRGRPADAGAYAELVNAWRDAKRGLGRASARLAGRR